MILEEATWKEAHEMFTQTQIAIIPIGAIECHGPHNPMGIECYVVSEIAKRLNDRMKVIITPTIPVSYSQAWGEFTGTLWVTRATLKAYLLDICNCLAGYGIKYVFFLNGHGPNVPTVEEIYHDLALKDVQCAQIDLWRFIGSLAQDLGESQNPLGHSGEIATSIMIALRKDLVRDKKMRVEAVQEPLTQAFPNIIQYYPSSVTTPSAFVGDPTQATHDKGVKILERCTDRLEEFLRRWISTNR